MADTNSMLDTQATNAHSEYVIRTVFLLRQWMHERTSVLLYAYLACLVRYKIVPVISASDVFLYSRFIHGQ